MGVSMPSNLDRVRTLVGCGLLPEVAQLIVEEGVLQAAPDDARITTLDRARAQLFALYSPLVPDNLRLMFDAATLR